MFERFNQWVDPKFDYKKIAEYSAYIKPLLVLAAVTVAYTAGFLSRIDPGLLSLFGANLAASITFQLFLHISIAGLVFYAASLIIGALVGAFSLFPAKWEVSKRVKRFPEGFRSKKLEVAYQQFFIGKVKQRRKLLFSIKSFLAFLAFFQFHLASGIKEIFLLLFLRSLKL